MKRAVSPAQLAGYMTSWSAYVTYRSSRPGDEDPAAVLTRSLEEVLSRWPPGALELVQALTVIKGKRPAAAE